MVVLDRKGRGQKIPNLLTPLEKEARCQAVMRNWNRRTNLASHSIQFSVVSKSFFKAHLSRAKLDRNRVINTISHHEIHSCNGSDFVDRGDSRLQHMGLHRERQRLAPDSVLIGISLPLWKSRMREPLSRCFGGALSMMEA